MLIDLGGPTDRAFIPLATRRGTTIPNFRRPEWNPAKMRASIDLWRKERPLAQLRSATSVYNCMGLPFASRRTWVETEHLSLILSEDSYRRLPGPNDASIGDLVVYRDNGGTITHIGVVLSIEPGMAASLSRMRVISKWGQEGEYIHPLDHVPRVFGKATEFWTERKTSA